MRPEDIEAVLPLERELFAGDPPWTAEIFRSELARMPASRWYVVAERSRGEAGRAGAGEVDAMITDATHPVPMIVGYAGVRLPAAGGDLADVHTIAVAPDQQRQGIGSRLLTALADRAQACAAGALTLDVREDNAAALSFYGQHGFTRIAVRPAYFRGRRDAIVMHRPLPPPSP
ncbi:GNAT family N-acetyltransferase [Phytoactinopolyspora limicola]|uniref:GNAT family N-acetyltransferase n=1 Tax=Phytoactinopolyspora limicola TaxID=2715536 RepID=UPI00140C9B35|nr:GNAT family N-acetyltransferase [Phytoactinopolyspora limicola]